LETELSQLTSEEPKELDLRRLRKHLEERANKFRELLAADVPQARQALRKLLAEPLQFTPVVVDGKKAYTFEGKTRVGTLLSPAYIGVASPRGRELIPILRGISRVQVRWGTTPATVPPETIDLSNMRSMVPT